MAQVRYTRVVPPLNLDADLPLIPYEMRKVLVNGALSEYFLQKRDATISREWQKRYKDDLKEMESDSETTDDELILHIDRQRNRRSSSIVYTDYETLVD